MVNPFFFDVSDDFPYPAAKLIITALTLLIETLSLFHYAIVIYAVSQNSIIHQNLKIVSYNLWVCGIVKCYANIFLNSRRVFFPHFELPPMFGDIFFITREVTSNGMVLIPSTIVVERLYCIINAKTYENWFSWVFIISICGSVWAMAVWAMLNLVYFPLLFPVMLTYAILLLILLLVNTCYFVSYFITAKKSLLGLTLSERYQRTQNSAAYRTVRGFCISQALVIFISILFLMMQPFLSNFFDDVTLNDKKAIYVYVYELIIACLHFVLPYYFVCVHRTLKTRYSGFFWFARFKHSNVVKIGEATPANQISSVTGQNLKVPDETNFYFKSLTASWDAELVKTK